MKAPFFETDRYAFYVMRVGACLVRKADNASVYFQPGDDAADAIRNVEHCSAVPGMWPGEGRTVFNRWCVEFKPAFDAHAAFNRNRERAQ